MCVYLLCELEDYKKYVSFLCLQIYDLKLLRSFGNNNFEFEIRCSAGTYIRSLCRDIAYSLSTYGTMLSIIRTKCGMFDIGSSCTLKDIEEGKISYIEV